MSVLDRSMFRRGYADAGIPAGIGTLEYWERPEQQRRAAQAQQHPSSAQPTERQGIASMAPLPEPDMGQVFGRTQQILADPRIGEGVDAFRDQVFALRSMSDRELLAARESGQFDPAVVEQVIEERGDYASPAGRALRGFSEGIAGGIAEISRRMPGPTLKIDEYTGWPLKFRMPSAEEYRRFVGRPAARAAEYAFTPRFGDEEAPSFFDVLTGRAEQQARPPAEPGTVPEGQRPDPAEAVSEAPEEPPRPDDPSPVRPIDTSDFPEPRPTDDPTAEQVAEATTPDGERLIDPVDPLMEAFERRGTMYEAVLGTPEERRQEARSRIMFDVAQRALQFAGGVGAEGQPLRGSVMAQAAQAFGPSLGRVAEESAALQEQDQRVRLAQMQAAEQEVAAATEAQRRAGESMQDFQQRLMLEQFRHELTAQPIAPLPGMSGFEEADDTPEGLAGWEEDLDHTLGFGTLSVLRNWANQTFGVFGGRPPFQETDRARTSIEMFNKGLMNTLARDVSDTGRISNLVLEMVEQSLPGPGQFTENPHLALNKYNAIRTRLTSLEEATVREFLDPGTTEKRRDRLRQDYHALRRSTAHLDAMRHNLMVGTDSRRGREGDPRTAALTERALMENQGGE